MRFEQALTPAIRARVPVRAGNGFAVIILGDVFGSRCREVYGTPGIVDRLLRIIHHEGPTGFLASIVAGVRLRKGETEL